MVVRLIGYLDVPEARLFDVLQGLKSHIQLSRSETGCLSFNVDPDPAQSGRLLVAETFTDMAAFERHQVRTKASDWWEISAGIPREYQVEEIG